MGGAAAFWEGELVFAFIAVILGLSLNIPMGFGGVYSAAQAALYGVGAYTAAIIAIHVTGSMLEILLAAILVTAVTGCFLIIPALRTRYEYFMIASLALQYVASTIFETWSPLNGEDGLTGLRPGELFGWTITAPTGYMWLSALLAAVCIVICIVLRRVRFGRTLRATREDENAAKSIGINVRAVRILSIVIGAGMAGAAGAIYAMYVGFVNPDTFSIDQSVLYFGIVILGGAGSIFGPVLGALFLTLLPDLLTYVNVVPQIYQAVTQQIIYGAVLVLIVMLRPDGLVGKGKIHGGWPVSRGQDTGPSVGTGKVELLETMHEGTGDELSGQP